MTLKKLSQVAVSASIVGLALIPYWGALTVLGLTFSLSTRKTRLTQLSESVLLIASAISAYTTGLALLAVLVKL